MSLGSPDCLGLRALSPTGSPRGGHSGCLDVLTVLGLEPLGKSGGLPTMRARSPGSRLDCTGLGSAPLDHTGTPDCASPNSFYFSAGPLSVYLKEGRGVAERASPIRSYL